MAGEITVARESSINPINALGRNREVNITDWDRAHGIDTPEKKQRALERAASSRKRKNEKIQNEINSASPKFGDEFVKVPQGGTIVLQPMNDGKAYSVYKVTKGGNTGGWERYTSKGKAIEAQKRMYNAELAKVKKRYNI